MCIRDSLNTAQDKYATKAAAFDALWQSVIGFGMLLLLPCILGIVAALLFFMERDNDTFKNLRTKMCIRDRGRTNAPRGNVPQNGYSQPQNGYAPNPGSAPNYAQGNPNQQPSGGYAPGNGAAPGTQGGYPGDGFTQVTEQQAETLPFVA